MARRPGDRLLQRLRERNPFPEGSATIGLWLIVAGVTAYLFLAVSGRALGSNRYSAPPSPEACSRSVSSS
jgi:hypothetical protein